MYGCVAGKPARRIGELRAADSLPADLDQDAAEHVAARAVAYTWAANGYLLAAVTALTRDRRWLDRIWAARVLIDVALVGITVALPAATR
jgi:hypothetical protein